MHDEHECVDIDGYAWSAGSPVERPLVGAIPPGACHDLAEANHAIQVLWSTLHALLIEATPDIERALDAAVAAGVCPEAERTLLLRECGY